MNSIKIYNIVHEFPSQAPKTCTIPKGILYSVNFCFERFYLLHDIWSMENRIQPSQAVETLDLTRVYIMYLLGPCRMLVRWYYMKCHERIWNVTRSAFYYHIVWYNLNYLERNPRAGCYTNRGSKKPQKSIKIFRLKSAV